MGRPVSLDEKLFRMPPKTEHFAVTRLELFLVHGRRLTCAPHVRLTRVHVGLARASARARARTHPRLILVYLRSATLNVCLSTYAFARLRFCLRFGLLHPGLHLLLFRRRSSSLRFLRLLLRLCLLWFCLP